MKTIAGVDVHEDGQGQQVIVMIHGWPDTHRLWDAQVQALQSQYRCVRFTLPGFETPSPRRPTSLADLVEIIRQIVLELSPGQPVTLMVHDWGCFFGYQFASLHPALVSRVIGLDIGDAGSVRHTAALSTKAKLMTVGYQIWLAAAWRIGGSVGDRMTRFMARKLRVPVDPAKIGSHMNYPYYIKWAGAYGSYRAVQPFEPTVPMLFIYGSKKLFMFHSPEWADELNAREGSQVVALKAGHWMMRDRPEQFNEAVLKWLSR